MADINQLREIAMDSIESVHVAYSKLVAENNTLRAENAMHIRTLLARNDSIIRLRSANEVLEAEVRALRAGNVELRTALALCRAENNALLNQNDELRARDEELHEQLEELRAECEDQVHALNKKCTEVEVLERLHRELCTARR